ncbi:MAG TPA: Ig-like domain-containing protein [Anaerolineales bacterium]
MKYQSRLVRLATLCLAAAACFTMVNSRVIASSWSNSSFSSKPDLARTVQQVYTSYPSLPNGELPQVDLVPAAVDDFATTAEDVSTKTNVTSNDSTGDWPHSLGIISSPSHGDANPNGKEDITYTPAPNYHGSDSYVYNLCDKDGDCSSATVTITITPVNDVPTAVGDSASTQANTSVTVAVLDNDSDVDDDILLLQSFDAISAQGGTVARFENGTPGDFSDDRVTYTPATNFTGTDTFSYQVSDGTASANAQVTVNVNGQTNASPIAFDDAYTTQINNTLTVSAPGVLVNDSDPDGNPLQSVLESDPSNGSLTFNGDGSFAYTPAANFSGTDAFTYRASDGVAASNLATVSIEVLDGNVAPIAGDDNYSVLRNQVLEVPVPGVLHNDNDPNGDGIIAELDDQPDNGTLVLNLDGSFTYTPFTDFLGVDIFRYRASDGSVDSNPAQVTISVVDADTEVPSVSWLSPVVDHGVISVYDDEVIPLEASASDNMSIASVLFYRWDALKLVNVEIGIVYAPPYRWELNASELNWGPNQINVNAYDVYGNVSERSHIWVYKLWRVFLPVLGR